MPVLLCHNFLFLQLKFADGPVDLLFPLSLSVRLFFIVNFPRLFILEFLVRYAHLRRLLLSFDRLHKLFSIELLNTLRCLDVVLKSLLIRHLRIVLLLI